MSEYRAIIDKLTELPSQSTYKSKEQDPKHYNYRRPIWQNTYING